MDPQQIESFVVRFHLADVEKETGKKRWRIKITHVQGETDWMFESVDDAMNFIRQTLEEPV